MNIFIDVTSSCRSPRNSGMQRMTRQLFAELTARAPVTPLCWNTLGNFYQRLGSREMAYLRTPFRHYKRPMSYPHARQDLPHEFRRLLCNARVDLPTLLQ